MSPIKKDITAGAKTFITLKVSGVIETDYTF